MDAISAGTVVKLAKTVYTRIDGVKVDKKQCAILKARVKSLEQVVLKAKPHAGVKDLVREMERILQEAIDFIDEEEKRGWLKRAHRLRGMASINDNPRFALCRCLGR